MNNHKLEAALRYAKMNLSVIPLGFKKMPHIKWEKYQHERATDDQIKSWWTKWPDANIGIVTGEISGIVAIDVEKGGKIDDLPETVISKTGRGGFHLIYKYNITNSIGNYTRIRELTDIRGDGGYIVAPPSKMSVGNQYEWKVPFDSLRLAEFPLWILKDETKVKSKSKKQKKAAWDKFVDKKITEGERNQSAAKYAGKLVHDLSEELWDKAGWPALNEWNMNNCSPPLGSNELEKIFESIKKTKNKNDTSNGVAVHACTRTPLDEEVSFNDIVQSISKLGEKRPWIIKAILAVFASTFFKSKNPLWLMVIGNPSSNKTTLVDLLDMPDIFSLDTMTANPFSSGQRAKENPQDLLPLLNNKCFIIKEYGTLFGRSDEMVKQLISDLVAIYDGKYEKHSPTRGTVRYKSSFSHIGCVTPMALNARQRYMAMVGARFLFLRIPELTDNDRKRGLDEIWNNNEIENDIFENAQKVVSQYCFQIKTSIVDQKTKIEFSDEAKTILQSYANLVARARGIVITDKVEFNDENDNKRTHYEVVDIQIEEPFRAFKQLKKFAECLAIINQSNHVSKEDLWVLCHIVLSSMPVRRSDILKIFEAGAEFSAKEASDNLNKNYKTVKRNFDELVALGILESQKNYNDLARTYYLKSEFKDVFKFYINHRPLFGDELMKTTEEIFSVEDKDKNQDDILPF